MHLLDWICLGVLSLSLVVGLWRGLVFEVLSLLAWVLAFVVAQWFAADVARRLPMSGAAESLKFAAGFALVFIATAFAGGLVATLIKKLVAAVGLRVVDRALGGLFGVLRGMVLLLAFAVVAGMTSFRGTELWRESQAASALTAVLKSLQPLVPGEYEKYLL